MLSSFLPPCSFIFRTECVFAYTVFGGIYFFCQLPEMEFYGRGAEGGTKLQNLLLGEPAQLIPNGIKFKSDTPRVGASFSKNVLNTVI